jgi:hypothetical protein
MLTRDNKTQQTHTVLPNNNNHIFQNGLTQADKIFHPRQANLILVKLQTLIMIDHKEQWVEEDKEQLLAGINLLLINSSKRLFITLL